MTVTPPSSPTSDPTATDTGPITQPSTHASAEANAGPPRLPHATISRPEQLPILAAPLRGHDAKPGDLVVLGHTGGQITMVAAFNLGDLPAESGALYQSITFLAGTLARQGLCAILLAFGDPRTVTAAVITAIAVLESDYQVPLRQAYRVHNAHLYCLLCHDCTPGGIPVATQPIAGLGTAIAADRDAVAVQYAYTANPAMAAAVHRAHSRYTTSFAHLSDADALGREVLAAGRKAVGEALNAQHTGTNLTDDQAAWLMLLLTNVEVSQHVWATALGGDTSWQLWAGLLGRAPDQLAAPAAIALALSSLLRGDGLTANIATDRARQADPGYPPNKIVLSMLQLGLTPDDVRDALVAMLSGPPADGDHSSIGSSR